MRVFADKLRELARTILISAGAIALDAEIVSDNLVESNLMGHDSHGVIRIPHYIEAIRRDLLNTRAQPKVVKEKAGSLVLDGEWGFGQVAAHKAVDLAIDKAKTHSVACASIFNCNDVGRLGAYTLKAAEQGFLGIMTVNDGGANPYVVPWGGVFPLFSTNPISAGIPMGERSPICVDMATSVIAGGKIAVAQKRGQQLPPGCIVNAKGNPTTDPNEFYASPPGALLPLGAPTAGHKGFALSLLGDILSGALSGAGCSGSAERDAQGVFILMMNIVAFTPMDEFTRRVTKLVDTIKSAPKAEGVCEIIIPGEPELIEKEKRSREGIFVEEATWNKLVEIAEQLGVPGDKK